MKTGYMILSAASIVSLLSSCASYQKTADSETWSVKPVFDVRHSTETPESYYQLGRYYQGQNRYEQAMTAYQKALAIDSGFVEARNGMGVIYSLLGRQQEALEQLRLAAKQALNAAHIHNNLGYALYLSGAYAEAASALERAVALEPANQSARINLALALDKAGDSEKARQVMAQVSTLQPAENVSSVSSQSEKVQQARTEEPASVPQVSTAAIATEAPRQALTQPNDQGVITRAAPKAVPVVESRIRAVQLAPNVYELREQVKVPVRRAVVVAQLPKQALTVPKERDALTMAAQQPEPVAKNHVQLLPPSKGAVQQARAVVPTSSAAAVKPFRIEVSNGNGVTGMARKVAGYLDGEGYSGARLTNQKPFRVLSSQVQYRVGYREQAQSLVSTLPGYTNLIQANNLRGDISIRVVLGKDLAGNVAYFEQSQGKVRVALKGPAK